MSIEVWDWSRSDGGHYSKPVKALSGVGMEALRSMFPTGEANDMNFVLFSTSGVHGSYTTIEDHEDKPMIMDDDGEILENKITFLIVQPRIVAMRYGNVSPKSPDDYEFLKRLRQTSWDVVSEIGR